MELELIFDLQLFRTENGSASPLQRVLEGSVLLANRTAILTTARLLDVLRLVFVQGGASDLHRRISFLEQFKGLLDAIVAVVQRKSNSLRMML